MAPFFNWRGIKQESERQRVGERETERGDAGRREEREGGRERGRRGERGMKSSEGRKSSTAKPKLPSERSAPAARSRAAAAPRSPAWPRPIKAPAGRGCRAGAGTTNLGRGAAPLSRERGAGERHGRGQTAGAERGERRRPAAPAPQPRPRRGREYFFKRLKLSFLPCFLGSLLPGIALQIPAGRRGAIPPSGASAARLTSRTPGAESLCQWPNPARAATPLKRARTEVPLQLAGAQPAPSGRAAELSAPGAGLETAN